MVQSSLKTVAIGLVWFGVIVFAFIITIIRKRRNQGQTTISPLDMTHAKKAKQVEIAKELLLMKVRETTTTFQRFEATGDQQDDNCDIEKGESDEAERTDGLSYSNACAVCLEEFEQGENIVRSVETKGCPHIFHESCMVEVISAAAKKQILHIPCPCCRQTFVEIEEVAQA